MSRFDDHFARSAVPAFAFQFGDAATYTTPAGSSVALQNVIFGPEKREKRSDGGMDVAIVITRELSVMCDSSHPQYCGTTSIDRRGTITFASTDYAIETVTESDATGMKVVKTVRYELSATAREGYYRGT